MLTRENAKNRLFELRCKYGKTQEQVSEGSGVSRITVNRIENDKIDLEMMRADTIFKLNEYFISLGEKHQ